MSKHTASFYNLAWRWHFYAGLFVIPFMIMLAVTGSIYLFKPQLDNLLYADLMRVRPAGQALNADQQLGKVRQAYPQAAVSQYLPPLDAEHSAQFVVSLDGRKTNLFLDPYSGQVLGTQDAQNNLQAIARALHGTLLIGTVGDRLIELAAGWAIVLVVSGLYLWWPRGQGMRGVFWPRLTARGRLFWRDLHAVTGFWGSLLLLFMLLTGTRMTHIPYKGAGPAAVDLVAGQLPIYFMNALSAVPHVRSGRLRALGVTSPQRFDALPQLPTIAEAGVSGYDMTNWYGMLAPGGTPRPVVEKVQREVARILRLPELRERLNKEGATVVASSPDEFARFLKAEMEKAAKVVKASGMTATN